MECCTQRNCVCSAISQSNHTLTDRTSIEQHPNVQAATTKVRDAYLDYARNTLRAPVTGYVAQRSV
jgi:membrane fusion protein (multidrug efflux system)